MIRLLYIEDNDNNAYMLSQRLKRRGYSVALAPDGRAGLDAVARERPDLIIMDLVLPELDGWEATRRLKADPDTRDIPVLALSSSAMPGDRERALEAGCDDYDIKPIDFDRVVAKIEGLLQRRR